MCVLILPMRNGNQPFSQRETSSTFVLILPMRNGNYTRIAKNTATKFGSYPTYEEWKHSWIFIPQLNFINFRSYPTYEEWKPSSKFSGFNKIPEFLSYL